MPTDDILQWIDEDGVTCIFQRRTEPNDRVQWYITCIEPGRYEMSTVDISHEQLVQLRDKIDEELKLAHFHELPFFEQVREIQQIVDEANRRD